MSTIHYRPEVLRLMYVCIIERGPWLGAVQGGSWLLLLFMGLAIRVRRRRVGAVDHCGGHAARGVDRDDGAEAGELVMYQRRRGRSAVLCRVVVAGRAPREVAEERVCQRSGAAVLVVDGRHELVDAVDLPLVLVYLGE